MISLLLAIIYLAFISLGLPDGLLGAAWPFMYPQFDVPVSYSGLVFMIIAGGTIIVSLQSDRLTRKLGTGKVTAISVSMTAIALFGFSFSSSYPMLCFWAIPYGLGAGGVDASINNYVALHYESKHMSWLHCMWGVGAVLGPYILSGAVSLGHPWNTGYQCVGLLQIILTIILVCSLPLWKESCGSKTDEAASSKPLTIKEILAIPGAKEVIVTFFCYCALEQTVGLWACSYLVITQGVHADTAAGYASMFFLGITFGRMLCGFITMKLNDTQMIRLGECVIAVGVLFVLLPLGVMMKLAGFIIIGLGCAPVYPCIIHSTPVHFGANRSQAMIGVQMASAYVGTLTMPAFFGVLGQNVTMNLLPWYLLLILAVMFLMYERVCRKTKSN